MMREGTSISNTSLLAIVSCINDERNTLYDYATHFCEAETSWRSKHDPHSLSGDDSAAAFAGVIRGVAAACPVYCHQDVISSQHRIIKVD
jgi:hypothetical protein